MEGVPLGGPLTIITCHGQQPDYLAPPWIAGVMVMAEKARRGPAAWNPKQMHEYVCGPSTTSFTVMCSISW